MTFSTVTNAFFLVVAVGVIAVGMLAVTDILQGMTSLDEGETQVSSYPTQFALYDDFPEYHLNRTNIQDAITYNPTVQEILLPYTKIGFEIGIDKYTLQLDHGQYKDITLGIDEDVDFVAKSGRAEFVEMIDNAKNGEVGDLMGMLVKSDLPLSVKMRAVEVLKNR